MIRFKVTFNLAGREYVFYARATDKLSALSEAYTQYKGLFDQVPPSRELSVSVLPLPEDE